MSNRSENCDDNDNNYYVSYHKELASQQLAAILLRASYRKELAPQWLSAEYTGCWRWIIAKIKPTIITCLYRKAIATMMTIIEVRDGIWQIQYYYEGIAPN